MKFEFLQEIKEARIYRDGGTLNGKSAAELAKVAYLLIISLEILRNEDYMFARSYASSTLPYENFRSMRNSATDLHNLLAVLANQSQHQDKIKTDFQINIPGLQLKRYFRDIINGRKERSLDRALFKQLEDYLKIRDSDLRHMRRIVGDWRIATSSEKKTVIRDIRNLLNRLSINNDLFLHFRSKLQG